MSASPLSLNVQHFCCAVNLGVTVIPHLPVCECRVGSLNRKKTHTQTGMELRRILNLRAEVGPQPLT